MIRTDREQLSKDWRPPKSHLRDVKHIKFRGQTPQKIKNAAQDAEAKIQTSKDHAEGKPSSES